LNDDRIDEVSGVESNANALATVNFLAPMFDNSVFQSAEFEVAALESSKFERQQGATNQFDAAKVASRIEPPFSTQMTQFFGRNVPGRNVPGRNVPGRNVPGRNVPGHDVPGRKGCRVRGTASAVVGDGSVQRA
jgi:hypothetical protein